MLLRIDRLSHSAAAAGVSIVCESEWWQQPLFSLIYADDLVLVAVLVCKL